MPIRNARKSDIECTCWERVVCVRAAQDTYDDDNDHLLADSSNFVVLILVDIVNDSTNEHGDDQIADTATDQVEHSNRY